MSGWRLPAAGRIDRTRPLSFSWGGRAYRGFAGDTLASALMANGVSIVGRSFKYHRPRGLLAAGLEEPNAIVQLEEGCATVPNLKATQIELYDGLSAAPVNVRPSAELDLMAVNGWVKRFIPAAFYYKTFMWPGWRWFEPAIRRAAGLGVAPPGPDPDSYEHRFEHVDLLVVGGGAAGLAAALAGAEKGREVLIVEGDAEFGGELLSSVTRVEAMLPMDWLLQALAKLSAYPNVKMLPRTLAFGYYDHDLVALCERLSDHLPVDRRGGPRQRIWKVRADHVVLATGALERPLLFTGNDLPGVMLASAAKTYAARYAAAPGRRLVVATNNDSAYAAATLLHDAGVGVAAVIDSRQIPSHAAASMLERSIRVITGAAPISAKGGKRIGEVAFSPVHAQSVDKSETIKCDTLLLSGGWNPAVHLHSQAGGRLRFDDPLQAFLPSDAAQNNVCVGAAAGFFEMDQALASARAAVSGAAAPLHRAPPLGPVRRLDDGDPAAHKAWLDYQNDVTVGDVQLAVRENFQSVEHVKRYTTLGMASDQGKTSNVAAIQVLSGLLGKAPEAVGTTKFRPPFDPVTIGAFAGRAVGEGLSPPVRMAAHERHGDAGAVMEQYGGWLRPAYYSFEGEGEQGAVAREVRATRTRIGLFEASPLGKIEVKGPDAAEFLDRMYVNSLSTLKPGRCRYALMLNEHGVIFDDGVVARLAADHFLVGTTSGHAAAVAELFQEWLQCEWPQLEVLTENVTTGWAVMNLAGPRTRDVLQRLAPTIDLTPAAFPHMSVRSGDIGGVPARIQRVSFTGELSFEIAVPWRFGASLWEALLAAGAGEGIAPFGVEALMAMRIEKGFLHVGADTDGTTLPQDVGFAPVIAKKEKDFVGRRSTMRSDGLRPDRRQLVGLEVIDGGGAVAAGAHVLPPGASGPPGTDGWVTSAVDSPTLGRPLALALVRAGHSRTGETVSVWDQGRTRSARIVDPRFFDPAGERLRA